MLKAKFSFLVLLITSVIISCTPSSQSSTTAAPKRKNLEAYVHQPITLMISIDGFRADYLQKIKPPTLLKLAETGVVADAMTPSFPSLTFPNHITLVTGLVPGHHGIVSNTFYDRKRNATYSIGDGATVNDGTWYRGTPLWQAAEDSGMLAATCFWVGSEAAINGVNPTYIRPFEDTLPNAKRVEQVIDWLKLPEANRPHFITLYFSSVDSKGHANGPDSEEVRAAVLEVDQQLETLVGYIRDQKLDVNIVIVSDHGMQEIDQDIMLTDFTSFSGTTVTERGATMQVYAQDSAVIQRIYSDLKTREQNFKIYRPQDLPARWKFTDPTRTGDLVIVAEPGYYLKRAEGFAPAALPQTVAPLGKRSTHGWDPEAPSMQALFIANGPSIKNGLRIKKFTNVDVYPFMLEMMGLNAIESDGNPNTLKPILKPGE